MNKKQKAFVLLLLVFLLIPSLTFAHAGKTDEFGGHYDYDTGEYHYHHGYPAHQHTDGICPYDFDDKTNHDSSSGSSSSSSGNRSEYFTETTTERITGTKSTTNPSNTEKKKEKKPMTAFTKFAIFYIVVSLITLVVIIYMFKDEHNTDLNRIKALDKQINSLKNEIEEKDNTIKEVVDKANANIRKLAKENHMVQSELKETDEIIEEILTNNSLHQICKVPPDTQIYMHDGSYEIYQKGYDAIYGKYTGYISDNGSKYHFRKACSNANTPICVFDKKMIGNRTPCQKCFNPLVNYKLLTEPTWFTSYCKIKNYIDTYVNKTDINVNPSSNEPVKNKVCRTVDFYDNELSKF